MWIHKYMRAFGVGLQSGMEYRADFLIGMLSAAFPILIQIFMWAALYGGSGSAVMFNRSFAQMITYAVMAAIISRLIRAGFEYDVNDDIKNGGLSKYVVRPMGYLPYRMSCFLGQKCGHFVAALGLLAAALVVLSLAFHSAVVPLSGILAFLPALALALTCFVIA
jgi:ABC-2 type transport system permease protein